jgi:GT2 family glycosyltransferase
MLNLQVESSTKEALSMISASIVLYNTPKDQLNRIVNCINESTVSLRLYIVDNSPSPCEDLFYNDPLITYIRSEENVGYGGGHNLALRRILDRSEFHFVLNPDIHFGPNELKKMLDFIKQDETIGQLMPRVCYADGSLQYLCKLIPTPADLIVRRFATSRLRSLLRHRIERFELRFTGYDRVMDVPLLSGCFMLFRVSALRQIGLFDERFLMYLEDFDICRRMNAEFRTVFFPGATVVHDHARDSYRNRQSLRLHIQSAIKYFNKWGWLHDPARTRVNRNTLRELGL